MLLSCMVSLSSVRLLPRRRVVWGLCCVACAGAGVALCRGGTAGGRCCQRPCKGAEPPAQLALITPAEVLMMND